MHSFGFSGRAANTTQGPSGLLIEIKVAFSLMA
jgi:hypothetical protein